MMKCSVMAAVLVALAGPVAAEPGFEAARATLSFGAFAGDGLALPARATGDVSVDLGLLGVQVSATTGSIADPPASDSADALTDAALILFTDPLPRWRLGVEVATSTDAALGDTGIILAGRALWHTDTRRIDIRGAGFDDGPTGAFAVTVAMEERLAPNIAVRGLVHRYSTDVEIGDFYAIGLGGTVAVGRRVAAYGNVVTVLADDYSYASNVETVGIGYDLPPGHRFYAGITRRKTNGDTAYGLTAGLRIGFGAATRDSGALFDTDPIGMQLAHLGH